MSQSAVRLARLYDEIGPNEGRRVLVDGLWPRGIRKDDSRVGIWLPAIAPSRELRQWYGHDTGRFEEFRGLYLEELKAPERVAALDELMRMPDEGLTLTTATREISLSHAAVLASILTGRGTSR